jgi:hypothetical protein
MACIVRLNKAKGPAEFSFRNKERQGTRREGKEMTIKEYLGSEIPRRGLYEKRRNELC